MNAADKPRILLADDHPGFLAETSRILQQQFEVVGTASDGLELLEKAERLSPDLIVLDISMPQLDGFEVARRLRLSGNGSKVVFLTVWEDEEFAREALELGADAYVVKSRMGSDLIPAISAALAEHHFVSPTLQM